MEQWINLAQRFNKVLIMGAVALITVAPLVWAGSVLAAPTGEPAPAAPGKAAATVLTPDGQAQVRCWAFVAAAFATGIGSIAAGYAVGNVGTAAMGAVAEKPELMGKSLIYVALAEGIAIYGLLISIIVLAKV